jgi:hypothetical protein
MVRSFYLQHPTTHLSHSTNSNEKRMYVFLTMLQSEVREGGCSAMTTRITPVPSPKMPLPFGIEVLAQELEEFSVNAAPLYPLSPRIAELATLAGRSLLAGDTKRTMEILQETESCLREVILILKWTRIMERNRVPWVVMDHMFFVQQFAEEALEEIRLSRSSYSGRA